MTSHADIRAGIQEYGLMVLQSCLHHDRYIGATTCGFTEHGLPELIFVGMDPRLIVHWMNVTFHKMVIEKSQIPGPFDTDEWFTMKMRVVAADREIARPYARATEEYYAGSGKVPQYMQMAWPDAQGKFPWEKGFDKKFKDRQPNLRPRLELVQDITPDLMSARGF